MAHYDVAGELRPHVRGQVEALAASVDTLLDVLGSPPAPTPWAVIRDLEALVEYAREQEVLEPALDRRAVGTTWISGGSPGSENACLNRAKRLVT